MDEKLQISLDEFAKEEMETRTSSWVEQLPPEVVAQIRASLCPTDGSKPKHGIRTIVRWLCKMGYSEASKGKLEYFVQRNEKWNTAQK